MQPPLVKNEENKSVIMSWVDAKVVGNPSKLN